MSRPCSPPSGKGQSAGTGLGWAWGIWRQKSLVYLGFRLNRVCVCACVVTHLFRVYTHVCDGDSGMWSVPTGSPQHRHKVNGAHLLLAGLTHRVSAPNPL